MHVPIVTHYKDPHISNYTFRNVQTIPLLTEKSALFAICVSLLLYNRHTCTRYTHTCTRYTHTCTCYTHTCTHNTHTCTHYTHTCTHNTHTCTRYTHTCTCYTHMHTLHTHTCTHYTHTCTRYTHTCTTGRSLVIQNQPTGTVWSTVSTQDISHYNHQSGPLRWLMQWKLIRIILLIHAVDMRTKCTDMTQTWVQFPSHLLVARVTPVSLHVPCHAIPSKFCGRLPLSSTNTSDHGIYWWQLISHPRKKWLEIASWHICGISCLLWGTVLSKTSAWCETCQNNRSTNILYSHIYIYIWWMYYIRIFEYLAMNSD